MKEQYRVLDLFSGAGGMSYGLEMNKQFKVVIASDFNESALKTFKKNNTKAEVILGDITDPLLKEKLVEKAKEKNVNMIVGGPPCQGFSLKGKKLGLKDQRNFLFLEFMDIVSKINPEILIIENVKSLMAKPNKFFLDEIILMLKKMKYKCEWGVLNAKFFGVPQSRERTIIIGSKTRRIHLPEQKKVKIVNIRDAISDLDYLNSGESSKSTYLHKPMSKYQSKMRKGSKILQVHKATNHSELAVKKMKMIPEGGDKTSLPISLRTKQKFNTTWSRLNWDEVSPTIDTRFDTPSNGKNIHPTLDRAITPREAARIQSFPDSFHFIGNKTSICKQIGNAVPPLLAKAIADHITSNTICQKKEMIPFSYKKSLFYNADSLSMDIDSLELFDAIITDPPYSISKKNNFDTLKGRRGIDFGEWDKNFDFISWIEKYYEKLKPGGTVIIFCSYLFISYIIDELTRIGGDFKDVIRWVKKNPMPRNINRRYVLDAEYAIWGVKPGKPWTFNKGKEKYKRAEYTTSVVSGNERLNHPTQKSLKLMEEIILTHTKEKDLIIDPFAGTGTTLIAAIKNRRRAMGIEKNNKYYSIATKRILRSDNINNQ